MFKILFKITNHDQFWPHFLWQHIMIMTYSILTYLVILCKSKTWCFSSKHSSVLYSLLCICSHFYDHLISLYRRDSQRMTFFLNYILTLFICFKVLKSVLSHSGEESEQVDGGMESIEHEDGENDILHHFVGLAVIAVL